MHYQRWRKTGDPLTTRTGRTGALNSDPIARFWHYVDRRRVNECWEWLGGRSEAGYGRFKVKYTSVSAHRFSYELHHGPIPEGLLICHRCDNPPCCNPRHLFAGTASDNMFDASSKGRINGPNNGFYGRAHTSESRARMSEALKGKRYPQRACGTCGRTMTVQNYSRHRCLPM